jgi:hypothetical protein
MRINIIEARCLVAFSVIFLIGSVVACGGNLDEGIVKLADAQLQLEERNQMCYVKNISLSNRTEIYDLGIPWPCGFHKSKSGEVRIIRSGKYEYSLIESSQRIPGSERDCETHLRAVRAKDNKVHISEHKDKVASCPPFQWDKLVFTELFK